MTGPVLPPGDVHYSADGEPLAVQARRLVVENQRLTEQAQRVRELHCSVDRGTGPQCQGCATHVTFTRWPCDTIRALDGDAS